MDRVDWLSLQLGLFVSDPIEVPVPGKLPPEEPPPPPVELPPPDGLLGVEEPPDPDPLLPFVVVGAMQYVPTQLPFCCNNRAAP